MRIFKIFIAEILRMLRDRKWLYLLIIAVVYIVICRMFASYRYKLDLDYGVEMRFGESAFKIWQFTMDSMQMGVLLYVLPPMVYVLSYMNDRKEKVDQYICVKSQSDVYYAIKYVVAILGGMILNFLFVTLLYLPLYQIIASHVYRIDDLDRVNAIQNWGSMQLWHHLREASVYLPVSVLNYNEFVVLLLVFLKYYIGLVLLAMIGLIFSIRKDSVQYDSLAMLIVILFNLAMLEYDGPWNFYGIGISVDLSKIFRYISLQRYFIFEFADIKYDVMRIFAETYVQGAIWFLFLFGILYQMFERRDL